MARIRSVHPDLCSSETMTHVTAEAERTFVRLWTHCDDAGRCIDNPKLIKAALFPLHDDVTAADIDGHLKELEHEGVLLRYESGGKHYISVTSWGEFQKPQRPTPSKLPAPSASEPLDVAEQNRKAPCAPPAGVEVGDGEGEGVDPPGGGATAPPDEHAQQPTTETLVAGYVSDYRRTHNGRDPTGAWRGAAGKATKALLAEGEDADVLARCLGAIARESKNPANLPHVVADFHTEGA